MKSLDRRRLLTSGAAAAVFAATGFAARAKPLRGGVLRLGLSGGDPSERFGKGRPIGQFMRVAVTGCAFETLTVVSELGILSGELATHWEPFDRGCRWVFRLRDGVVFHDGRDMDSQDVVFSLRRRIKTKIKGPLAGAMVRRVDSRHVGIILTSPEPDLPMYLADPEFIVHPAFEWENALARGNGTGLYRIEQFRSGRIFVAKRVEGHWKGESAGWFGRIEAFAMATEDERISAISEGRVDAVDLGGIPDRLRIGSGTRLHPSRGQRTIAAKVNLLCPAGPSPDQLQDVCRIPQQWSFG